MKILCLSDQECSALWEYYIPGRLDSYDLILSCGDLKSTYLTFLVTMAHAPLLYVHGNHDEHYLTRPPEGCDCIDDSLVKVNGLRILGLGGCLRYHPGPYQYTEREMARRIRRLRFALWRSGGVDIVVTHAPPRGIGDLDDPAHRGFTALRALLDKYHPTYLLHGHVHMSYSHTLPREETYGASQIINCYERYTLDLPHLPSGFPDVKYLTREPKIEDEFGL